MRSTIIFCLFFVWQSALFAQKANKKQGDAYFEVGLYCDALAAYNQYNKIDSDMKTLVNRGVANYYCNKPDAAIQDFLQADKLNSTDKRRLKYSGLSYMSKMQYEDAAKLFKMYLNSLKSSDEDWLWVIEEIKKCGFAKDFMFAPQNGYIENVGTKINTEMDEFSPIQSPTQQGRFYFSSNRDGSEGGKRNKKGLVDEILGKRASDMYYVDLNDGNWSSVLPLELFLSTPKEEIIQDFSPDGSILYFIKSQDSKGAVLYADTFSIERDPSKLPTPSAFPFDASKGDQDLTVFNDSLILFASSHLPGYGGYDLFYCKKNDDTWGNPVNLGPTVNSKYNEISPYLVKSGSMIFFSSDRIESLGGYDFFKAVHVSGDTWKVQNLGAPINSPKNETDFELLSDGMSAIFTSDRIESIGGKDVFIAYFRDQIIDQLSYIDMPVFCQPLDSLASESVLEDSAVTYSARDFVSKPLYYRENEDIINPGNISNLDALAEILTIYPKIGVLLVSHGIPEGRTESDLYFSIKRAEKVADYFKSKGINAKRIMLQGCGSDFPLAMNEINGIKSSLADKNNRRIDVYIFNNEPFNLRVINDMPIVAEHVRDTLWDQFYDDNKGLTFRVKMTKVNQMLKNEIISKYQDIIIEKNGDDDQYTYTCGNFKNYNDAIIRRNELLREKIFDSDIWAYYKGMKVESDQHEMLSGMYPEFKKYLNSK